MSDSFRDSTNGPRVKVARLVDEYDLDGVPVELERAWLETGEAGLSLRQLAVLFNERLVEAAMMDAGMNPLAGEAANVYELLAGEATSGAQVRAERRLGRNGIDVDALRESFVSHQAIHTYLTKVREVEHDAESATVEGKIETVERLLGRTRSVSEGVVEGLAADGELAIGTFEVSTTAHVTCRDCNNRYELAAFLRRGHCDCDQ